MAIIIAILFLSGSSIIIFPSTRIQIIHPIKAPFVYLCAIQLHLRYMQSALDCRASRRRASPSSAPTIYSLVSFDSSRFDSTPTKSSTRIPWRRTRQRRRTLPTDSDSRHCPIFPVRPHCMHLSMRDATRLPQCNTKMGPFSSFSRVVRILFLAAANYVRPTCSPPIPDLTQAKSSIWFYYY